VRLASLAPTHPHRVVSHVSLPPSVGSVGFLSLSLSSLISKLSLSHLTLLSLSTKVEREREKKKQPKERLTPPTSILAYFSLSPLARSLFPSQQQQIELA
jgi:hypothetical protein